MKSSARSRLRRRQRAREDVVAAPAAAVRGQLRVAGQVGHQRPDHGAVAGDARLDRDRLGLDPAHHLELLVGHLAGVGVPVALAADEERRLARVAVRGLHDQVVAEPRGGRELEQLVVARRPPEHVRDARDARLLAQLRGDDLRVEPVAELGRGQRDVEPDAGGAALGLLVEEHEHRLAARRVGRGALLVRARRTRSAQRSRAGSCRRPRSSRTARAGSSAGRTRTDGRRRTSRSS